MLSTEVMVMIQEALKDEKFSAELFALDTIESIQEKFATKGIELTYDETKTLVQEVVSAMEPTDGELSEDILDDVTGGGPILGFVIAAGLTAAGTYIGWKIAGKCGK